MQPWLVRRPLLVGSVNHAVASRCRMKSLLMLTLLATALHQTLAMPTNFAQLTGSYLPPNKDNSIDSHHSSCPPLGLVQELEIVTNNIYETNTKTATLTATNRVHITQRTTLTRVQSEFAERSVTKGITETLHGTVTDTKYITIQTADASTVRTHHETQTFLSSLTHLVYETTTNTIQENVQRTHFESGTVFSTDPVLSTTVVTQTITPYPIYSTERSLSTVTVSVLQAPSTIVSTISVNSLVTFHSIILRTPEVSTVVFTRSFPSVQYQTRTITSTTTSTDYKITDIVRVHTVSSRVTATTTIPVTNTVTRTVDQTVSHVIQTTRTVPFVATRYSTVTRTSASQSVIHETQTQYTREISTLLQARIVATTVPSVIVVRRVSTVQYPDVHVTRTLTAACTTSRHAGYSYPVPATPFNY